MPYAASVSFKIFVGLTHIMIMLELTIRVEQSILIYDLKDPELIDDVQTDALYKAKETKERRLKQYRFALSMAILVTGLALIVPDRIAGLIAGAGDDPSCERYHYLEYLTLVVGCLFLTLCAAHALC